MVLAEQVAICLQTSQSKAIRLIARSPGYVRNEIIRNVFNIPHVRNTIMKTSTSYSIEKRVGTKTMSLKDNLLLLFLTIPQDDYKEVTTETY